MPVVDERLRRSTAKRRRAKAAAAVTVGYSPDLRPASFLDWKGILDRIAGALLLIPGIPIIAVLVVLVRLTSRGPGIFRQKRVGRNGRIFDLYKIRTMRLDAEVRTGAVWAHADDPRVTPLGGVLRRFHLDEFPQLLNVVRGDMSLVGPRPERPEFVPLLAEAVPGYLDRLAAPPGITGLAQLNLPPDTDLDSVRRKLVLDLEYVEGATLLLDLRIFLGTAGRLVKVPLMRVLRIQRNVVLDDGPSPPGSRLAAGLSATELAEQIETPLNPADGPLAENGNGEPHTAPFRPPRRPKPR